jgi:hypothetical protein
MTLREGWSQVCRLTGIAQRRLDSCIHIYIHRFCFIAACHGNKDKSYSTEPKDPIHPIQKSERHLKISSLLILVQYLRTPSPVACDRNFSAAESRRIAGKVTAIRS